MLADLKEQHIDAELSAKVAKVVWQELVRDAEKLKRAVKREETKKGIVITLILAVILFIGGCQTLKGGLQDVGWTANKFADNINPEENK